MKKIKICFLFLNIFFFYFVVTCDIYAFSAIGQGNINASTFGFSTSTGSCSASQWQGCYSSRAGYRFTLVDSNGRKVEGTRSVDFLSSEEAIKRLTGNTSDNIKYDKIFSVPRYKYSQYYKNDAKAQNDENSFVAIYYDGTNGYSPNITGFKGFIKDLEAYENIESAKWALYDIETEGTEAFIDSSKMNNPIGSGKYPFLDVFLHYCGFLKDNNLYKISLIDNYEKRLLFSNPDYPYYLLIEPTYFVYYNEQPSNETGNKLIMVHKYGTVTEFGEAMWEKENGLSWGLSGYFTVGDSRGNGHLACELSTPKVANGIREVNQNGVLQNSWDRTSCLYNKNYSAATESKYYRQDVANLINPQYGYGVYIVNLTDQFTICTPEDCPHPHPEAEAITFDADYCKSNDGIVSFGTSENVFIDKDVLINGFKYTTKDENGNDVEKIVKFDVNDYSNDTEAASKIACYDEVTYDFSKALKSLSSSKNTSILLNIPKGTATVTRKCWVGKNAASYTRRDVVKDYQRSSSTDGNNENYIRIKAFREEPYNFSTSISSYNEETPIQYSDGQIRVYKFTVEYTLEELIIVPENVNVRDFYIKFPTRAFGQSNKLFKGYEKDEDANSGFINFSDSQFKSEAGRKLDDNSERCMFNPSNFRQSNLEFRVISLNNPFPARNGTARLPGKNWLNDNTNNVYQYITNNRGVVYYYKKNNPSGDESNVNPETMYSDMKPIYSITLTPSTMLKIRNYNKNNKYDSMYLSIDTEIVRSDDKTIMDCMNGICISQFLRNTEIIPSDSFKGTCALSKKDLMEVANTKIDETETMEVANTKIDETETYSAVYLSDVYKSEYDYNMNGRMDSGDFEIARTAENRLRNKVFYTCADKSYLSSGYNLNSCSEGGCGTGE